MSKKIDVNVLLERKQKLDNEIANAKSQRRNILTEIVEQFTPEQKTTMINDAERELKTATVEYENAKSKYTTVKMKTKEVLELCGAMNNGFGKTKNRMVVDTKNVLTFTRDGVNGEIVIDRNAVDWQKMFIKKLTSAGLVDGTQRGIIHRAKNISTPSA